MIFVRHGEKKWRNNSSTECHLDAPLTENGKEMAREVFSSLLHRYGKPKQIVSSPYMRTRETAEVAHSVVLRETGKDIPIIHDRNVGEFLGYQKEVDLQREVHETTFKLNPIGKETFPEYSARIDRTHEALKKHKGITWVITHGVFIQSMAYKYGSSVKYPSYLSGFGVSPDGEFVLI